MTLTPASSRTATPTAGSVVAASFASGLLPWTTLFDETKLADAATFDTGAGGFSTSLAHLLVIAQLRTTEAIVLSQALVTINGDGAANYDVQLDRGRDVTPTAADAQATATAFALSVPGATAAAGVFGACLVVIPNYAATVAEGSALSTGGFADEAATGGEANVRVYHWRDTAAINRLVLTAQAASNFLTGSRVTVYGVGV